MAAKVFVNPASGSDDSAGPKDVAEALPDWELVEVDEPDRLQDLVGDALQEGAGPIGVAGGDGTVRSVAEVLAGTGVPLLVIPTGTRNHFARELGHEDLESAAAAARAGNERPVSVGRVNGRIFLNNASIGLYPDLVRRRERQAGLRSKAVANLVAAADVVAHGRPVDVDIEGDDLSAWLVFVGNGRYGDGFYDLIERDSLDSGILDVRVVRADRRLGRLRLAASLAAGGLRRSKLVVARETAAVSIGVSGRVIDVAVDGELMALEAPLCFEVAASGLTVLAA